MKPKLTFIKDTKVDIGTVYKLDLEKIINELYKASNKMVIDILSNETLAGFVCLESDYNPSIEPLSIRLNTRYLIENSDQEFAIINLIPYLKDHIESCAEDGSYTKNLKILSTRFKELAKLIDEAISKEMTPEKKFNQLYNKEM